MRPLACLAILTLLLSSGSALARERVLQEWSFADAKDTLGWKATEPLDEFDLDNGALAGKASEQTKPKVESPMFGIAADASQFVEIEMRTNEAGTGLMHYSNTTEEPDHGFRPGLVAQFRVKGDGQFHTYTIFPFWQNQGKITHIRIDPPGSVFAIRAVRIISSKPEMARDKPEWIFKGTAEGWRLAATDNKAETTSHGWRVSGGADTSAFSPAFDTDSDGHRWVTIRALSKTSHTMLFRWAGSGHEGQQALPIQLRGDGLMHSYSIDLSHTAGWKGRIQAVGLSPSDSDDAREITLALLAVSDGPCGPPDLEITYFGLADSSVYAGGKAKVIVEVRNCGGMDARSVAALLNLREEGRTFPYQPPRRIPVLKPNEKTRFEWEVDAKNEGEILAVCRVTGFRVDAGQKTLHINIQPADRSASRMVK